MVWSYLINSSNQSSRLNQNPLTFEEINSNDIKLLIRDYCELIDSGFFSSFSSDYDTLIISETRPDSKPLNQPILFIIKFNDIIKIKKHLQL